MNFIIRQANQDDIIAKALVHYQSWTETYKGLMPQEFLDSRTIEKCESSAAKHIDTTLVAEINGKVVGFACYKKDSRKANPPSSEIVALYVLKDYQALGIGTALMNSCLEILEGSVILYVLANNENAINFYKSKNFKFTGIKLEKEVLGGINVQLEMKLDR
ncbi:MAG: GNAT family N-acetyltransferase [Acholeplasmatales bacterium]|nr:GNAT family N-acetyltransferase [Acholeplasmatales bacterium]